MKSALITGITGQDGHHLTKLLLSKGYEVHGLVNGQRNSREESFVRLFPEAKLYRGDLTDFSSLLQVIDSVQPDEIYNLGAIINCEYHWLGNFAFTGSNPEIWASRKN